MKKERLTLVEIHKATGISYQTLIKWRKTNNYRAKLVDLLSGISYKSLEKHFKTGE
jgi:hypothetical protein